MGTAGLNVQFETDPTTNVVCGIKEPVGGNTIPIGLVGSKLAAFTVPAYENGKIYLLDNAAGFVVTLPSPSRGLVFEFIVLTPPTSGSYTIVTAGSSNIIIGLQNSVAGDAGDTGTADDTITFVANNALAGDKVRVVGSAASWFAYAISKVAAGVTFTQAS